MPQLTGWDARDHGRHRRVPPVHQGGAVCAAVVETRPRHEPELEELEAERASVDVGNREFAPVPHRADHGVSKFPPQIFQISKNKSRRLVMSLVQYSLRIDR